MQNRLIILGVAILAVLYVVFSSLYVVDERDQAIVMRFGQITDVRTEPGIYFKIPTDIVDSVQIIEDRLLRYDIANMRVQVSGNAFYQVDAFLTYRISDPRLFRERATGQLSVAEDRIGASLDSALREVYGLREFNAALSEQRAQMMQEVRDLIRPDLANLGIDVVDVRILRTDLDADVSATTFERMRAERLAEAALLRARGQEQAQSLRAIADRQSVEIVAAATRDAEIIRGTGDAERNRLFAAPMTAPVSNEPALDGLGIEETTSPSMTLEDGSELTPTVGTEVPTPAEAPAEGSVPSATPSPVETPAQ